MSGSESAPEGAQKSALKARARELVRLHGDSSNSFMTLYDGFQYFESARGIVAYYDMPRAWVAGCEPMAPAGERRELFQEFVAAARKAGKGAAMIPVTEEFANWARGAGYSAVMVGGEPMFKLETYPPTGQTWLGMVPTAKQLHARGARVREIDPTAVTPELRAQLDAITAEWLGTRKTAELSFLNKVEPWTHCTDKKYFLIEYNGRITAFLAGIPIWARNGWYLIDVLRRNESEPGTTELLLLEAMRLLRSQGAREISWGVAPLSDLEHAPEWQPQRLNRLMRQVYEQGDLFYNFKSLHQYKLKFRPNHAERAFIVFGEAKPGFGTVVSTMRAFTSKGFLHSGWEGLRRALSRFSLADWIKAQVDTGATGYPVVVRSVPPNFVRLVYRCRFTSAVLFSMLAAAILTQGAGGLEPEVLSRWGFSWDLLGRHGIAYGLQNVVVSGLLHWHLWHLASNSVLLVVFCGVLEYLGGSALALLCFLAGYLGSDLLTGLFVVLPLKALMPVVGARAAYDLDVGTSLGIMATAGALALLLRWGRWLAAVLVAGCITEAIATHSVLSLNHLFALALGAVAARLFLRS